MGLEEVLPVLVMLQQTGMTLQSEGYALDAALVFKRFQRSLSY